jgi:crossover junction endodeoxyribonuclease RuvC
MRILGIDPGANATGWGVIETERGRHRMVAAGVVRTRTTDPFDLRLLQIHAGVTAVIAAHRPVASAIEEIFQYKSAESALRLGMARGVALLALAQAELAPAGYNPMTVKRSVGADGRADKAGVAKMVGLLLGIDDVLASDATDALAIAITHAAHARGLPVRPRQGHP